VAALQLYYVTQISYFSILPLLLPARTQTTVVASEQIWYWTYLVNWQIGLNGWPEMPSLGHFCSLAVEERFYLFWPLAVFLLSRYTVGAYVLTPARMDALALQSVAVFASPKGRGC